MFKLFNGIKVVFNKKKLIIHTLITEGRDKAIDKYLELCKYHSLVDAIRYVDKVKAKMK